MIRPFLPLVALASAGCGPEPDPTRTFLGPGTADTTGAPVRTHRLTWQVDGAAAVEMDIFDEALHVRTASGAGCSPSVLMSVYGGGASGERAHVSLYFSEPPAPGVEAALPTAHRQDPNDPFAPYFVPVAIDGRSFLGGTVTVDASDSMKWSFRFDGLSDCTNADTCTPVGGATLVVEPLPYLDMPEMSSTCIAASPFPWPDGWDGCAVTTGSFDSGPCPTPMPW